MDSERPSPSSARIRQGLAQFVGAMAKETGDDPRDAKQLIAASLVEEAILLAVEENGEIDGYVTKPVLRGAAYLLRKRNAGIRKAAKEVGIWENVKPQVDQAEAIAACLQKIIDGTTKEGKADADGSD